MKNAQKPEKVSLGSLLRQLKEGRFVIPDFQREFEWKPWDVRDLLKSIFQDYYVGTLLLWKGKKENFISLSCEDIYGHEGDRNPSYIVLDGQQRLTAIYYAMHAPAQNFPRRKSAVLFYLKLDQYYKGNSDDSIEYQFVTKKWSRLIEDKENLFSRNLFPLSLLGKGSRATIKWLDRYSNYWESLSSASSDDEVFLNQFKRYIENGSNEIKQLDSIKQILRFREQCLENVRYKERFDSELDELESDYHISYIELDEDIHIDKVCDIFTQINSKGVRLDIFDLLNALLKPKGIQLKSMWREAQNSLEFLETGKMNVYILQVISILLQNYCSSKYLYFLLPEVEKPIRNADGSFSKIILINDGDEFRYHWAEAVEALELGLNTLKNPRDYGAIKHDFVPYPSIVPAFCAIRRYARQNGIFNRLDVGEKVRRWYWSSIFSNRYSSSVESTAAKDFIEMKKWFADENMVPQAITEYLERHSNPNLQNEINKGTAIYTAMLNLLVIHGAKDLANGQFPEYDDLDDHHIVPHSWGKEHVGLDINSLCNKTLITSETNRYILRNKMPSEYLSDLVIKYGDKKVREILDSHFISQKAQEILMRPDFSADDYYEFIAVREKSLVIGIDHVLLQQAIDRSPTVDEFNQKIEFVEKGLRDLINYKLSPLSESPFVQFFPDIIKEAVERKISTHNKKFPGQKNIDSGTFIEKLKYTTLGELTQVILAKNCWAYFEEIFGSKQTLQSRTNQLTTLRNTLAHNNDLNEIMAKDGEASIIWFENVIKKNAR